MFSFGKKNRELEDIISSLEANKANNYKDNAQADYKELRAKYEEMVDNDCISAKQKEYYKLIISDYAKEMSGYTHKDQTPYWT